MKRSMAILLICALLLPLTACQQEQAAGEGTVTFYYCRKELTHGSTDSVIAGETRDTQSQGKDLSRLLTLYFMGPRSQELRTPFPVGLRLVECRINEGTAYVTVTDALSQLTGIELTLACACITRTVLGLSEAEAVHIQAETSLLGSSQFLLMDEKTLLLFDGSDTKK